MSLAAAISIWLILAIAAALPAIYPIPGFAEPVSSLTHLLGAAVFAVLGIFMIRKGCGHAGRAVALAVFVVSVVFMFSMSGVYHLLTPGTTGRAVLQRLDHAGIFLLIAGSFTAAHAILVCGHLQHILQPVQNSRDLPANVVFEEPL